ncbi:MAG: hypothetical protein ATN36_04935 [Epulopiscium sp. Nele67-Bin005]|nr:MAG: hypothetical protein ATN36_04935 [Epulopiscium sp. Nele67-Bin005]
MDLLMAYTNIYGVELDVANIAAHPSITNILRYHGDNYDINSDLSEKLRVFGFYVATNINNPYSSLSEYNITTNGAEIILSKEDATEIYKNFFGSDPNFQTGYFYEEGSAEEWNYKSIEVTEKEVKISYYYELSSTAWISPKVDNVTDLGNGVYELQIYSYRPEEIARVYNEDPDEVIAIHTATVKKDGDEYIPLTIEKQDVSQATASQSNSSQTASSGEYIGKINDFSADLSYVNSLLDYYAYFNYDVLTTSLDDKMKKIANIIDDRDMSEYGQQNSNLSELICTRADAERLVRDYLGTPANFYTGYAYNFDEGDFMVDVQVTDTHVTFKTLTLGMWYGSSHNYSFVEATHLGQGYYDIVIDSYVKDSPYLGNPGGYSRSFNVLVKLEGDVCIPLVVNHEGQSYVDTNLTPYIQYYEGLPNVAFANEVHALVNEARAKEGLEPLILDTQLTQIAQIKSEDMNDFEYLGHESPLYGTLVDLLDKFGIDDWQHTAENLALGQQTATEVVNAWLSSEGHRKNILNETTTHMGVGYDSNYWTQIFLSKAV